MAHSLAFHKFSDAEATYFMMPAQDASSITASDSVSISPTRAVWVGTGGDVKVQMAADKAGTGGDVVIFKNVVNGQLLPLSVVKIYATDTTASDILVIW